MNYQTIIEDLQKLQEFDTKQNELRKLLDDNKSNMSFTLYATMVDLVKLERPDLNMLNELMMASLNYLPNELHKKNLELQHKLDVLEKDYNDNLLLLDHTEGKLEDAISDNESYEDRIEKLESELAELQEEMDSQTSIDSADLESYIDDATEEINSEVSRILHNLFTEITEN